MLYALRSQITPMQSQYSNHFRNTFCVSTCFACVNPGYCRIRWEHLYDGNTKAMNKTPNTLNPNGRNILTTNSTTEAVSSTVALRMSMYTSGMRKKRKLRVTVSTGISLLTPKKVCNAGTLEMKYSIKGYIASKAIFPNHGVINRDK